MFTGIITHLGKIDEIIEINGNEKQVIISSDIKQALEIGQSISCNGMCLTITKIDHSKISFFVSHETLDKTTASSWKKGDIINIELAMGINSLFNGHIVTGHIDITAKVKLITKLSDSNIIEISMPKSYLEYLILKGSVTVNGVSLTVNEVLNDSFTVNIIPHTWNNTNLQYLDNNDQVNIEVDILAKYIKKYNDDRKS